MYRNSLLGEPIAYPFGIWRRQILPGLDLEPLPFEPELSEVTPTVDILDEPEVLEGTRELLQHPPYDSWFLDVPELFNLIDPDLPASMRNTPAGVQDLAIRQIILPNLSTYLRSLDLNADLLARLGLPDLARQTMIVRTALATADREVIAATGFVQGLIQQTLDRLHEANLEKYAIPPSTNLH